jgi:O-antigen ligase
MDKQRTWSNRVVCTAAVFAGFGVAHLIDDFLFGVPAEFHLSNPASQVLGLPFFVALTGLIALAARGSRASYAGLIVIGLLLAAADTTRHIPEMLRAGPYRSGLPSMAFAGGLILSGLTTAAVAYAAWRAGLTRDKYMQEGDRNESR